MPAQYGHVARKTYVSASRTDSSASKTDAGNKVTEAIRPECKASTSQYENQRTSYYSSDK